MKLLDMVWPAIYIASGLAKLWYCIFFTILIEWIILKVLLKLTWIKTFLMSVLGNTVSGLAGIYIMPWLMLLWHFVADRFMPHATFDVINWICTFLLMCIGSVLLETLVVKLVFRIKFKKLFLPMLAGNIATYLVVALLMIKGIIKLQ